MQPMLATRGDHVPTGDDWTHEVKWDGIRALVEVADGRVRVWSRNENDISVARSWPSATACRRSAPSPTGCTCATS